MLQGTVDILDVPSPQLRGPGVLVLTSASLISAGTERAAVDFAKGSLLAKARSRPDLVRQVVQKVQRDGVAQALGAAMSRLDRPTSPGYACAGKVLESSADAGFTVGDRVACAGAGYATHAEVNYIPKNLVVPIPKRLSGECVGFDEAAFTTLGAIALHGVRLSAPQLGDRAVVIGLGVLGLLAVQILRANGSRVAGVDLDAARCDLARALGADWAGRPEDAAAEVTAWSRGLGADLALVTAAASGSEPAILAAELSRDRGRIVAVGATGLDLPRPILYQKELSVTVSRSYGPGRYDPEFEEHGRDYPLAYVRWTERENMRAFLDLVADGSVNVRELISHRFPIAEAERAYEALERERVLGIVLDYPDAPDTTTKIDLRPAPTATEHPAKPRGPEIGFVGVGNFARGVLLPAVKKAGEVRLGGVVAATGLSARSAAEKYGFRFCSTNVGDLWRDRACGGVIVATRHDTHATLVMTGVEAGKAVFVEKPLCLTEGELESIESVVSAARRSGEIPFVMVGFNRRFAPATELLRSRLANAEGPINIVYRINAGRIPSGTWVTNEEGGGRILGEVCHFVDLCAYLAASPVNQVSAMRSPGDADEIVVNLRLANGSIATVAYLVNGDPASPKERVEVFSGGRTGLIDDFRRAKVTGTGGSSSIGGLFAGQDKGHHAEIAAFVAAVRDNGPSPVPFESAVNTTRATFAILRSLELGTAVEV